ncbi:MAG: DUF2721 domain-containing protein [Chlorobium limicola]|jgi:hypothetical protein|uniref:DUF2721 domain-containing protein n=1 Tax=Chlorobium limicola (strain DSM 245 / NBRC 103803 / 6330) TaxID=290315 RepID=B3EF06_CHLL2|nr:DUF2721 domain-containing protein [Chlorobium limicola]ACD90868.1 conserved hypothetical protein [Chlorobium limicola DSM 245]NTV08034.1 DUF2721 domain-containing protein [Chlorobium limicola]NTV20533.1 DUF2721 domain-containing protein [Chlorobium limicola]
MTITTVQELVPILQTAIGPMILISGLGLLLLTMTNRLGRIIDRSRALLDDLESESESYILRINREVDILWKRARYIRIAILLACMTCLGASMLIILLFLSVLVDLDIPLIVSGIFIASMFSLSFSLVFFLFDVNLTLAALKIERESHSRKRLIMEL